MIKEYCLDAVVAPIIQTKPSDQFPTDKWLMSVFSDWFDPCPLNAEPEIDGLVISWREKTYVNPPYSNPLPWVEKAITERERGCTVVMLLKLDTTTKWYKALVESGAHFIYVGERLRHGGKYPAPFSSVLVVLEPKEVRS